MTDDTRSPVPCRTKTKQHACWSASSASALKMYACRLAKRDRRACLHNVIPQLAHIVYQYVLFTTQKRRTI